MHHFVLCAHSTKYTYIANLGVQNEEGKGRARLAVIGVQRPDWVTVNVTFIVTSIYSD